MLAWDAFFGIALAVTLVIDAVTGGALAVRVAACACLAATAPLGKLGVSDRTAAVTTAIERGEIAAPGA